MINLRCYIAGPMRSHYLYNFGAFFHASMCLRKMGHQTRNPAERDMAEGFNPSKALDDPANIETFDLKSAFEWDFEAIQWADAIVLLPGWETSKGVQAELVLAVNLGRDVYEYVDNTLHALELEAYTVTFEPVNVDKVPF